MKQANPCLNRIQRFEILSITLICLVASPLFGAGMSARLRFAKDMKHVHVLGASISPNSKYIATLNGDHTVKIWNLQSGKFAGTLQGHKGRLMRISWSGNGRYLATGAFSQEKVKIWDMKNGKLVRELAPFGDLASIALSKNGNLLAVSGIPAGKSRNGVVELWDVETGKRSAVLSEKPVARFNPGSLRFSPDGRHLAAGIQNRDHGIMIWDIAKKRLVKTIKHSHDVIAIDYSPDGSRIAGGGMGNAVYVWDVTSGRIVATGKGHKGHITGASFHPSGRYFATSSFGTKSRFRVWDANTGKQVFVLDTPKRRTQSVTFSPDGKSLAVVLVAYGNLGDPVTLEVYDIK